jgi:hypothetical protein
MRMTVKSSEQEIIVAADKMIARYGKRAAIMAADWANSARDRGQTEKYEFWQWVCMDINERDYQKARVQKQIEAGEAFMDRYHGVFEALAKGCGKTA